MSVDQLPDRLNLSSFVGDDFSVLIEFVDEDGAAFAVAVTDLEASIHRDTPVPLTLAQASPSSVTLSATDADLGDTVRTDNWSLRYTVTDRTWFAGNFAITDSVRTGTFGNGDVLSVTVGTAPVQAVVTAVGPRGLEGPEGPVGPTGSAVISVQEEGVAVTTEAGTLNFVGATVTEVGGVVTITISGGGSSAAYIEDPDDPGLYLFSDGPFEDPGDPGLYFFSVNDGLTEDPSDAGLYLIGT